MFEMSLKESTKTSFQLLSYFLDDFGVPKLLSRLVKRYVVQLESSSLPVICQSKLKSIKDNKKPLLNFESDDVLAKSVDNCTNKAVGDIAGTHLLFGDDNWP